ncbi:thiamine phosphate synthase, partial [Streptococcus equi]|nr:thiamine phosphate synthase [Streptococcus equi]
MIDIFIAITTYKHLTEADLQHFIEINKGIDGLLFRTP